MSNNIETAEIREVGKDEIWQEEFIRIPDYYPPERMNVYYTA